MIAIGSLLRPTGLGLDLQLALQFVEETPIRVLGNELLRIELDQARFVQPQCVEAEAILRVVVPPNVVANLAQRLERIVVARRISPIDEQLRRALGLGYANIDRLEDRSHYALGGNGIAAGELGGGRQH